MRFFITLCMLGLKKNYFSLPFLIHDKLNDFNKYSSSTTQLEEINLVK